MTRSMYPPDSGTPNVWTVAGGAQVSAYPVRSRGTNPVVLITNPSTKQGVALTPHQARALCAVLPAAAAFADDEPCPGCGNPLSDGPHGMSEYGGCV